MINETIQQIADEMGLLNCENDDLIIGEVLTYFDEDNKLVRCVVRRYAPNYKRAIVTDFTTGANLQRLKYNELWRETK